LYNLLIVLLTLNGTANFKYNVAELIIFACPRTNIHHLFFMLGARCLAATNMMYEQVGPVVACMQTCSSHRQDLMVVIAVSGGGGLLLFWRRSQDGRVVALTLVVAPKIASWATTT
jgi:hypothetical protein